MLVVAGSDKDQVHFVVLQDFVVVGGAAGNAVFLGQDRSRQAIGAGDVLYVRAFQSGQHCHLGEISRSNDTYNAFSPLKRTCLMLDSNFQSNVFGVFQQRGNGPRRTNGPINFIEVRQWHEFGNEWLYIQRPVGEELQNRLKIAVFGPADIGQRVVAALLLVVVVVAAPVRRSTIPVR